MSFSIEDVGDLPVRIIYQGYDQLDYEIIGGMVLTPLTLNHVRMFLDRKPLLVRYFNRDNQYEPHLMLTHIFPNSQTHRARCFDEGLVVDTINDIEVRTLDEFRDAAKKSAESGYLTMKATDGRFMVLSLDKVLEEEAFLSMAYIYKRSALVDKLTMLRAAKKELMG